VGSRISEIRRKKSLPQEQLATKLDVTTQWLSRVENGHENVTLETIDRIAKALNVNATEFFVEGTDGDLPARVAPKKTKTTGRSRRR
jgi:transcriptional regulator with XRE-family HTH domain